MALGLYQLARTRTAADPDARIRKQIAERESNFLDLAHRIVFSNPAHPYRKMFQIAGCEEADLAGSVAQKGIEATLESLRLAGVWLSHDEFKGKREIIRSGRHIPSTGMSFRNPLVRGLAESSSSGSRSKGTLTRQVPEFSAYRDVYYALAAREFGLETRAEIQVRDILPAFTGIGSCLRASRLGKPVERWFTVPGSLRQAGHYRSATQVMVVLANLFGASVPSPAHLPANDFSPVAEWIARRRGEGVAAVVHGSASAGVRIASAAVERKLDIRGTIFFTGGEALTGAKREAIEAAGCRAVVVYWIHEIGPVGFACRQMHGNSVHHFHDASAAIQYTRRPPLAEQEVSSLLFTTLLTQAPRFLINAEMDDAGVLRPVRCQCAFSRAGFTTGVHDIFSYGKLTGQGMTLVGTDILTILEERLPMRLGGRPGDYQLVEQECSAQETQKCSAQTQITLRVSPRAGPLSAECVRNCFLEEIRGFNGGAVASRVWEHAAGVQVLLEEPYVTGSGKVLPLHLLGTSREGKR